jgi:sodium transport system permease protein
LVLAINSCNQLVSIERVELRDVDPALLVPVELESLDLATPEQLGGFFAAFSLPVLIGIITVVGGLFIAIDVTAGEKERGTLEALLVAPASDAEIFFGKLAAVFTMTAVPIVLAFMGFWAASNLLPESVTKGAVLPIGVIFGAVVVGLPLALFIDVGLMIFSIRTKTFKDAQSSVGAMQFAVMIPALAAAFVPATESTAFLIPIYGPASVVATMAVGGTIPDNAILFGIISSLLAASVAMVIALRLFNRERLLYSV